MRWCIVLLLLFPFFAQAQKKLPNLIENNDRRKVDKARSFLNEGEIELGLKLLTKIRDENMGEAYFHEALTCVEKQILRKLMDIQGENSNEEGEYFLRGGVPVLESIEIKAEESLLNNGLARSVSEKEETFSEIKDQLSRKDRKAMEKSLALKTALENDTSNDSKKIKGTQDEESPENDKEFSLGRKKSDGTDELKSMDPKITKSVLIQDCRLATLKHPSVDSSSHFLRMLLVDTTNYNHLLSSTEIEEYEEAYDLFRKKDYNRCATKIEPIATKYPDHFDVQVMLGDAFYHMGLDSPTYRQYRFISIEWPNRPEGFERLSRFFLAKGNYKDAAASILEAILVYPEHAYWDQLQNILSKTGRKLDRHWIERKVYPIKTDKNYEEIMANEKSAWLEYQKAKAVLYSYAPPTGLIRENEITELPYLELYGWYTMLVRSQKPGEPLNFAFARSLDKMGYIDCYVLIALFHHDLYDQFKDLVKNNPKKVREFFYVLINWEDKRFDKYRLEPKKDEVKKVEIKKEVPKTN